MNRLTAVLFTLLMLAMSLSVAANSLNEKVEITTFGDIDEPQNVISNSTLQSTTVSPSFGPNSGGTNLTITGSEFLSLIDNSTLPELISRSWTNTTVDGNANVGSHTSIAVDSNDNLHISYFGAHNSDLKYATYDGSSWTESLIDSGVDVGEYTSIAVDSKDNVHISYYDSSNADLKYATFDGSSWTKSAVDSNGSVGEYTSIAVDSNDDVHISYYDSSNGILKYATYNGSSWSTSIIDNMPVGEYTSIAVDSNDEIHISYYDFFNADLKYATYNGSSWSNLTIDSTGDVGEHTSIAVDSNDDLHISYRDNNVGSIKYATFDGINWTTSLVDGAGSIGSYTSLVVDSNDNVHISYRDYSNADLKYATFEENENSSGWVISTPDSTGSVGWFTSIAVDSKDDVHISYFDTGNGNLKYAKLSDSNSSVGTNEITIQFEEYGNVTGTVFNDSIITVTSPPGVIGDTVNLTLWSANGSGYVLTSAFTYLPDSNTDSDSDGDGIDNELDDCPNSPGNSTIGQIGCQDYDGDGYGDYLGGNNTDAFINNATQWADTDGDGFGDNWGNSSWNTTRLFIWPGQFVEGAELADHCPTEFGNSSADGYFGCPDADGDGIADLYDSLIENESQQQSNESNESGSLDSDGDGVEDFFDVCPSTIANGYVDIDGCLLDQDGDGVDDLKDTCPNTSAQVSVNVNGCAVENDEKSFIDSIRSGEKDVIIKTAGFGAVMIAILGFLQTNFVAALLPDSLRWLRIMKGNSKLNKEEVQELEYLKSLVQTYYQDQEILIEELFQLKSELTARYTNSEIKKVTREKLNTIIEDLLKMSVFELNKIAHNDSYFGLYGATGVEQRSDILEMDKLMISADENEMPDVLEQEMDNSEDRF